MKKIYTLSAAAVFLFAFAACQKENVAPADASQESNVPVAVEPQEDDAVADEPVSGSVTFTASIEAPKTTLAADGRQTWRAGDKILVSNGAKTISPITTTGDLAATGCSYNSTTMQLTDDSNSHVVAEWIAITEDMIASDGKTLRFHVNVYTPDNYYCFFVTGSNPHVYSMTTGGRVVTRQFGETGTSHDAQDAHLIARCAVGETAVTFNNTLAYLSLNCSDDYYAVSFFPNSGAGQIPYKINADLSNLEYASNTYTNLRYAAVSAVINKSHDTWYLPLAPNYTFAGGFTLILWSNSADYAAAKDLTLAQIKAKTDWTGFPKFLSTTKDYTPAMGRVMAMGDVCSIVSYSSYYDMWQSGKDIVIDGVGYNKNMTAFSGLTATRITSNQNISAAGVYFVADGVTATMSANISGSVIVMGDTVSEGVVGSRGATLATNNGKQFTAGDSASILLKGLTVNHTGNDMFNITNTDVNIIIDDCFVKTGNWKTLATIADGASVDKFAVTNSDLLVRQGLINNLGTGSRSIGTLKLFNSVFCRWNDGVGASAICQGVSTTDLGEFSMTFNSFINFSHQDLSYDALHTKSADTFTATHNYFYLTADGTRVYFDIDAIDSASYSIVENYSTGYVEDSKGVRGGVKFFMGATSFYGDEAVSNQFVSLDLSAAKPNFQLSTTAYGAQR